LIQSLKFALILLSVSLVCGCSVLQKAKVLLPERFGLVPVTPNLYVEAIADKETRAKPRKDLERAESAIRAAYGSMVSHPIVYACVSEGCYNALGGRGAAGMAFGERILLSQRGLNWHIVAHEFSHAELFSRLPLRAWWHQPQWFDEGLAAAISEAPQHSESQWQFLVTASITRPTPDELHRIKSLRQWFGAVRQYGDDMDMERHAKGEHELHVLYSAAGHEVRPWLENAGNAGLLALIEKLNSGEEFETAYETVKITEESRTHSLLLATQRASANN
jgi:hypothetical protein